MATAIQSSRETRELSPPKPAPAVAYIMSRFPKLTETFVLYEILQAEKSGTQVEVFPLRREKVNVIHHEAKDVVSRAHYTPWISWTMIAANLSLLFEKPGTFLRTLWIVVWANLGSWRYFLGGVLYFPKAVYMAQQMRQLGIRHVHAHFCSHPAAAAFVIHQLTGIPYSFTAHGSDLHCDRHMLREKVEAADSVITISQYNRQVILDECGQEYAAKTHVIHCGVDLGQFKYRQAPTAFDQGAGPLTILCIGTLHEVKGQQYLLGACRILDERGIRFECHLIGDGIDRSMLENLARKLGIADRVIFHGRRTRQEILAHLATADVLVTPSVLASDGKREGIPVVLMEAMASGVPCIGSRLSGIPELLREDCGLLVEPGDSAEIAAALETLSQDAKLRSELAQNGRKRIEAEFDLSQNTEQLLGHFSPGRANFSWSTAT